MLSFLRRHNLAIIIILATTLLSLSTLLQSGVFQTHDGIFHTIRAVKMLEELRASQFPVRWIFSLDHGYGVPLFNYVYPAPYYLTAIPQLLGISNITSLKLLTILSYFVGGLGFYFLAINAKLSKTTSILIGLIYLFIPYHFVNIFVRGSLGETMVMGLAPWALLTLQSLKKTGLKWYSPLPLTLALLSHNFLGLLLTVTLFVYSLFSKTIRKNIFSISLSLTLSAFFIIPMIAESSYLLSSSLSDFSFLWSEHFIYPSQFFNSSWGYLFSRPGIIQDGMTFQLGYGALIILFVSLIRLRNHFWTLILIGTIYLMTPYSTWLWEFIPFLSVMQFPWRLLGITTIVTGFLLTNLATQHAKSHSRIFQVFLALVLIISIYNTWSFHSPRSIYPHDEFDREYSHYQSLTTTSYRDEIVPRWAHTERYQSTNPSLISDTLGLSSGPAQLTIITDQSGLLEFTATAENDSAVAIYYQNYFPSWHATIDDQPLPLTPSDTGEILIPLSSGEHTYSVFLGNTLITQLSNYLSLLSIIILGMIVWKGKAK